MPNPKKISLHFPHRDEGPFFATDLPVTMAEINYGGHLGHDSVLTLMHEARVSCLKSHGLSELNVSDTGPAVGLILSELQVQYLTESFHGDVLRAEVLPFIPEGPRWFMAQRLVRLSDQREIARAIIGMTFFSYENKKVQRAPDSLMHRCQNWQLPV
ncbi:MAG: thioesterase family protein [Bdellovibrio sp.]|nr:thioesterase family protein [Bdellovibrio sp.]